MRDRAFLSICALVSLRYEENSLLPWLAWHSILGFELFFIYIDHRNAALAGDGGEWKSNTTRGMLQRMKNVTVFSMQDLGLRDQSAQLAHCAFVARKHTTWMASWDIDEVPALGPPTIVASGVASQREATPAAGNSRSGSSHPAVQNSVARLLRALPGGTTGIPVPRIAFDCAGRLEQLRRGAIEYSTYTRRHCGFLREHTGKVIWRADGVGVGSGVRPLNPHDLVASRRSALRDPDGKEAGLTRRPESNNDLKAGASVAVIEDEVALTTAATALRLHHYLSRSEEECERKRADARGNMSLFGWRSERTWGGEHACRCTTAPGCKAARFADLSVAQHSHLIREVVTRLTA